MASPSPDPADALASDLRAYLRLLDRCGMRHVASGGPATAPAPVIDPADWDGIANDLAAAAKIRKKRPALRPRDDDETPAAANAAPPASAATNAPAAQESADINIEESPAAVATDDEGEVTVADAPPADAEPLDASPETDELRRQAEAEEAAKDESAAATDLAPPPADDPDQLDLFAGF